LTRDEIIQAIHKERERQEDLHPEWDESEALAILSEEFGGVGRAVYETKRAMVGVNPDNYRYWQQNFESELIQVASVCFRILENRD
jgi:hypothetical protein